MSQINKSCEDTSIAFGLSTCTTLVLIGTCNRIIWKKTIQIPIFQENNPFIYLLDQFHAKCWAKSLQFPEVSSVLTKLSSKLGEFEKLHSNRNPDVDMYLTLVEQIGLHFANSLSSTISALMLLVVFGMQFGFIILPGTGWTDRAVFCLQFELDSTIGVLMLLVMFGIQYGYNRWNLCKRNIML